LQIRMSFVVGQPAATVSECRYRRLRPCDLNLSPTFPSSDVRYQSVDLVQRPFPKLAHDGSEREFSFFK
jgi:hypothetical protein